MLELIQLTVVGITTGAIYGLLALGFTLIYNGTGVLNFSQGEFVMVGAVAGAVLLDRYHLPYLLVLALVVLIGVLVGAAAERLAVRPIQSRHASPVVPVIATLAFAIMISTGVRLVVGTQERYAAPLVTGRLQMAGVSIPYQNLIIVVVAVVLVIGLWFFLSRTMIGLAMRATGIRRDAAALMGIDLDRMRLLSFALSAAVAAVAGLLIVPILPASPYMGLPLAVKGFISGVVGGLADPFTAFLGGIAIGLLEAMMAGYVSSSLTEIATFVILPVMLLARPRGLFGARS